jgi:hypothetical protein
MSATVAHEHGSTDAGTPIAPHSPCLIYDDQRPIVACWYEQGGGFSLGQMVDGAVVTQIVAYKEHGEGDFVPWLAVYTGHEITLRCPASRVTICYAPGVDSDLVPF